MSSEKVTLGPEKKGWFRTVLNTATRQARLPDGQRVFAIGDIHGRSDLLDTLLERIAELRNRAPRDDTFVFLGDYIDRGPDSKGVLDRLIELRSSLPRAVFLLGNHDQTFLDFLNDPMVYRVWRNYGGAQTLLSYGVRPPLFDREPDFVKARDELLRKCPEGHIDLLRCFEVRFEWGDFLFVHAGIRPGVSLNKQRQEDFLWIRDDFLYSDEPAKYVVVHGHTPTERPICRPNRIGVDTGAHTTGNLTAAVIEGAEVKFLSTADSDLRGAVVESRGGYGLEIRE